jgi:hypothetical protein
MQATIVKQIGLSLLPLFWNPVYFVSEDDDEISIDDLTPSRLDPYFDPHASTLGLRPSRFNHYTSTYHFDLPALTRPNYKTEPDHIT